MNESWQPIRRSPLHARLLAAGAVMRQEAGWSVASHFGDADAEVRHLRSTVGLSDRSFLSKWQVEGKDLVRLTRDRLGWDPPAVGGVLETGDGCAARLTRHRMMVIVETGEASDLRRMALDGPDSGCVHLLERTHGVGILRLDGPLSPQVLRRLTALDLRQENFSNLRCASVPVAGTVAVLLRRDRGDCFGYEIWFDWYYGDYLWDAVLEAGEEFAIRPVGRSADTAAGADPMES